MKRATDGRKKKKSPQSESINGDKKLQRWTGESTGPVRLHGVHQGPGLCQGGPGGSTTSPAVSKGSWEEALDTNGTFTSQGRPHQEEHHPSCALVGSGSFHGNPIPLHGGCRALEVLVLCSSELITCGGGGPEAPDSASLVGHVDGGGERF